MVVVCRDLADGIVSTGREDAANTGDIARSPIQKRVLSFLRKQAALPFVARRIVKRHEPLYASEFEQSFQPAARLDGGASRPPPHPC